MTASHLGTIETLIPGAQISVKSGEMTYSLPKAMSISAALDPTKHPPIGTILQILGSYTRLESYVVTREEGEMATVTYHYAGFSTSGAEVDNTIPLYPGRAWGSGGKEYSLDVSVESVSIMRHRYIVNGLISQADQRVLAAIIQNGPMDSNGNATRRFLSGNTFSDDLADLIEGGQASFLSPSLVWTETSFEFDWDLGGAASKIGKITIPGGPYPSINGDWLLVGATGSGNKDLAYTCTLTWQSSIIGDTWDTTLYQPG